ncbi:MAG: TetR/AcrR family transcriptional regulator [Ruminococcaceae bacterium]|nr:TetR/AcrR family transcriptional regulator [Oscillospiraceae bacterium]
MNRGSEVRGAFINSAIRVTADQGIQNATTKALSKDSGLSEVYIYRYFRDKDDLFRQAFYSLDKELTYVMISAFKKVDQQQTNVKSGFQAIYHDFWQFCLGDMKKCSFFIQYYYSTNYQGESDGERKAIYQPVLDLVSPAFAEGTDAWVELNHMYDIIFPKMLRVIRGTLANNKDTEEGVYRDIVLMEERNMLWNKVFDK